MKMSAQHELCRLCMTHSASLVDTLSSEASNVLDKINLCLHVKISEEDKASKKVCTECLNKTDSYYKFYYDVKETQKKWEELNQVVDVSILEAEKEDKVVKKKKLSRVSEDCSINRCEICQKKFNSVSKLIYHIASHDKKYSCSVCDYSSVSSSNFKIHMMKHNKTFKYNCNECGKGFYVRSLLKDHILIKHSNEIIAHSCPTCKKTFQCYSYLKSHLKIHDKKIYQCDACGKTFLSPKSIRRHILTIHEGSIYKCNFCDKEVCSLQSLKNHRKIHTGEKSYVCDICGKGFCTRNNLVVHKRIHSGDKPYNCNICNKSFSQISTLKVHKRYHTGERPYPCSFCTKSYVTLTLKKNHEKTHGKLIV